MYAWDVDHAGKASCPREEGRGEGREGGREGGEKGRREVGEKGGREAGEKGGREGGREERREGKAEIYLFSDHHPLPNSVKWMENIK